MEEGVRSRELGRERQAGRSFKRTKCSLLTVPHLNPACDTFFILKGRGHPALLLDGLQSAQVP